MREYRRGEGGQGQTRAGQGDTSSLYVGQGRRHFLYSAQGQDMIEHVSTCIPLQLPTPSLRESDHHHNQKNGTCESEMTPISCQFFCVPYKYKMRGESI